MAPIDVNEIKASKKIKTIIEEQQLRIWHLERVLDDLARAAEIAQYSGQYNVTEAYRADAEELLKDRIVLPEIVRNPEEEQSNIRIFTGEISAEQKQALADQITQQAKVTAGVKA